MRGTIYKRKLPSGSVEWQAQLDAGRDENGKRIRITKSFARKGKADDALDEMKRERQDGLLVKKSPKVLREFLQEWLKQHVAKHCSPKTAERYGELAAYVLPHLGDVALRDLSTLMLERAYNKLHESGGRKRRPLSARTVKHVHDTIRCALNTALRWRLLRVNPAIPCELPKIERKEARVLEKPQIAWLTDATEGHAWLYALLIVAGATGLRRGELLALSWPEVDLMEGSLMVRKSLEQTKAGLRVKRPKSERIRRIVLPATAVQVLKEHRIAQQQFREAFGEDYRNDLDLVFASAAGEYLKPASVTAKVCLLTKTHGLKGIGLQSLRHTHGSQLLSAGVPLPTVSKRLGHSSVNTTANIYAHAFAADEVAAAEAWDRSIGDTIRKPPPIRQ